MTDPITVGPAPDEAYGHRIESVDGTPPVDGLHVDLYNDEYQGQVLSTTVSLYTGEEKRSDDVDFVGRVEIHERDDRAHLWELLVSEEYRGRGLGGWLFDVFAAYVRQADVARVSGRIKNNGTAHEFLANRFPEECLTVANVDEGTDNPYEAVAIAPGLADPTVEVAEALERFDGVPADVLAE